MDSLQIKRFSSAGLVFLVFLLSACSSKELQTFAKDVGHNYGCTHQYENSPNRPALQDNCINRR